MAAIRVGDDVLETVVGGARGTGGAEGAGAVTGNADRGAVDEGVLGSL